jgi:hypothetical protein
MLFAVAALVAPTALLVVAWCSESADAPVVVDAAKPGPLTPRVREGGSAAKRLHRAASAPFVSGVVVGPAGTALAGASVCALLESDGCAWAPFGSGESSCSAA